MACSRISSALALSALLVTAPALAKAGAIQGTPFFEPNAGQAEGPARFLLRTTPATFFFTGSEVVLASSTASPLRVRFLGVDARSRLEGAEPRPGTVNYFVGSDPERFNWKGTLLSSTYLGGNNSDVGYGIALTRSGTPPGATTPGVHVSGLTLSQNFPVVDPLQATLGAFEDPFVAKLNLGANNLLFSTYFGGTTGREEYGSTGIALDGNGNVYIAGGSEATDFPIQNPYQPMPHGSYDVFLTRIDALP